MQRKLMFHSLVDKIRTKASDYSKLFLSSRVSQYLTPEKAKLLSSALSDNYCRKNVEMLSSSSKYVFVNTDLFKDVFFLRLTTQTFFHTEFGKKQSKIWTTPCRGGSSLPN